MTVPIQDRKITRDELAALADVTPNAFAQFKRAGRIDPPPFEKGGTIALGAAGLWLRGYIRHKLGGSVASHGEELAPGAIDAKHEAARKDREAADKLAIANAKERGELVEAASVQAEWEAILTRVKTRLLAVPVRVSPMCVGLEQAHIAARIDEEIRDALRELSGVPFD